MRKEKIKTDLKKSAAVIGAGIGGMAAAVRLAVMGYDVTVYEKNPTSGGKMGQIDRNGFRFDTGPSLFTLPVLVEELFELCGENAADHFRYGKLESDCRYFFPDSTVFDFHADRVRLEKEIHDKTSEDPKRVFRRLDRSREVYEMSAPVFLFSSFRHVNDFRSASYRKMASRLYKLDFFRTMHGANRRDFTDPAFVRIFDRYATYNGSDPYRAPATLNMIAHLENNIGAFFPEKGMRSIAESIYRLALRQGVEFRFGTAAEEIVVENGKAAGIKAGGRTEPYGIIVCGADARYASEKLLPLHPLRKRLRRAEPSSSALIFYWGMKGEFPELDLHNIFFAGDYKKEFDDIFRRKTVTDDPTVYVFISSKRVPADAPAGCGNWFVMINVPADDGQDWEQLSRRARRDIIGKLSVRLGRDLERCILFEERATPPTLEEKTWSAGGALYGTSSNSPLAAFLRHPNFLRSIDNLYFVGGSVHPGGGIPLCLAGAEIVEKEIKRNHG